MYRRTRSLLTACLLITTVVLGMLPFGLARAASDAALNVTLRTDFPVVNSGDWAVIRVDYSCSSITSATCDNVVISSVIPPELARGIADVQVLGVGATTSYNPATFTASWAFNAPINPGDAGTFELRVRFPQGSTPDGTVATLRAEISGSNAPPARSNALPITANANPRARATKSFVSGGVLDLPTVYQVQVCVPNPGSGALNLSSVIMRDQLPAGASFVSASDGGTYSAGTNTVTWPTQSILVSAGQSCLQHTVTVAFSDAAFDVGDEVRNDLFADATASNGAVFNLSSSDIRLIQPPTPGYAFSKSGPGSAQVGDTVRYNFTQRNTGTTALDNFTVTDLIPSDIRVSRIFIGDDNQVAPLRLQIEYQTDQSATWAALPASPFTAAGCVNVAPNSGGGCAQTLTLAAGAYITALRYTYLDSLPYGWQTTGNGNGFAATVVTLPANQIIVNTADSSVTFNGYPILKQSTTRGRVVVYEPGARPTLDKAVSPAIVYSGDIVTYTLTLTNTSFQALTTDLVSPEVVDLLEPALAYVPGSQQMISAPAGAPAPVFSITPNFNGGGKPLLRWRWAGYSLPAGEALKLSFQARIATFTPAGPIDNTAYLAGADNPADQIFLDSCSGSARDASDFDNDGNAQEQICSSTISSITLSQAALTSSLKLVKGQLDTAWTADPLTGLTIPGGSADYQLTITNTGTIPVNELTLVDILPWVGDVGVTRFDTDRESVWRPFLTEPIVAPAGATVFYSTQKNPCRAPDLGIAPDAPGCQAPVWSAQPPADITSVQAFKISFGAFVLNAEESLTITVHMRAPYGGTAGQIAWNSFGYRAREVGSGAYLLAAEPPRVGIERQDPNPPAYGNYVWVDQNKDGLQTPGEPGVNGVRVELFRDSDGTPGPSAGDTYVNRTLTGPDDAGNPGFYLFAESYPSSDPRFPAFLPPGDYYTRFTPPLGYGITIPNVGANDTIDSDVDPATRYTATTTLSNGEFDLTWDLGLTTSAAVGNYVWIDRNNNGLQDEPAGDGVNGVTVRLRRSADNSLVATTTTADDPFGQPGAYLFDTLVPDNYYVEFVLPAGFAFTGQDAGDDAQDSDANPATGRTGAFAIAANQYDPTRDAGLTLAAGTLRLGNLVWRDLNNDGRYDPAAGEYGIDGVRLDLYRDANNNSLPDPGENVGSATTTTRLGAPGWYQFENLAPGNYIVALGAGNFAPGGPLAGLRSSTGNQPTPDPDTNQNPAGLIDGDDNGDLSGGLIYSQPITLGNNSEPDVLVDGDDRNGNQSLDFGLIGGAALGNYVWFDTDANGQQNNGEPATPGVTVELLDGGGAVLATTTTDSSGHYGFSELSAGSYRVRFSGLPAGHSFTGRDIGGDTSDSDPDPASGTTALITLADGQDDLSWDAGLVAPLASIGDRVWDDLNRDGVQDAGEPGLNGVTARLYRADGSLAGTTATANVAGIDGIYGFAGLPPGDYYVVFSGIPAGYTPSPTNAGGDDATDSDADIVSLTTATTSLAPGESDPSWDLGVFTYASIGDRVWNDFNLNGVQDAGENGVSGVTVRLYQPGSSVALASTSTNASGIYGFTNLAPGDYYLEFVLPSGYRASLRDAGGDDALDSDPSLSSYQTIVTTLTPTENDISWDFGIYPTSSIGDRAWLDRNANGVQDAGEPGVPGVQVVLYNAANSPIDSTVSDATGVYSFSGLVPGTYSLGFILPPTFVLSPQNAGADDSKDSDVAPVTLKTIPTLLDPGESDPSWDIGVYQISKLGDRVWHDKNANGVQDSGEPGIAGVDVRLFSPGPDGVIGGGDDVQVGATATTDASGNYLFGGLLPGSYYVAFAAPAGYTNVSPQSSPAADGATDSDVSPATRQTALIDLASSTTDLSWDMGVYNLAALGDRVWLDANVNGVQDGGETGVDGVTVTLYRSDGSLVSSTTTAAGGIYGFSGLTPGSYYAIFSTLPADRSFTRRDQGGDDALDSDVNPISGQTGGIALTSGQTDLRWDAGIYPTIKVGDRVWIDANANGVQDASETVGVPGVRVELRLATDNSLVDYTYTDSGGNYLFSDLFPDTYKVVFGGIPAGYLRSPQDVGGDDAKDSDADASLTTANFVASSGSDLTRDLGLYQLASIGDYVWHDQNANGVQDAGEPAIAGATVDLYSAGPDGVYGGGDDLLIGSDTTDAAGIYGFSGLTPGSYYLQFALPTGYDRASPATQGADAAKDSDADPATLRTIVTALSSGEDDPSWDTGFYKLASLGNFVWEDTNGNGRQDGGEPGLNGAGVSLDYAGPDGLFGTADDQLALSTTTTAGGGAYSFAGLTPGSYRVTFTPLAGYQITLRDSGTGGTPDAIDSDADRASGQTIATTLVSGENDPTWDAGLYRPASLGDRLWEDLNGNGKQDAGESGVNGTTVTLRWAGPDANMGTAGDNTAITTTTAGDGNYSFINLIPGVYRVEFGATPANFAYTGQNVGADDTIDSDVSTANGRTANITLVSNQSDPTQDAGIYQLLSLGNRVWGDLNNSGTLDGAEAGIDGVTVRLYRDANSNGAIDAGAESAAVATTTTSNGGYYLFSGLAQGNYMVEIAPPAGYISSTGSQASASGPSEAAPDPDADTDDSDDNGTTFSASAVRSPLITLSPAAEPTGVAEADALPGAISNPSRDENSNLTLDFGLFRPASLGNLVWFDRDADGIQDGGDETGIDGVTVELRRTADDSLVTSAVTAGGGLYSFTNLSPDSYYLAFTNIPAGYLRSPQDQGGNNAVDSDADASTGRSASFSLNPGDNDQTWDAGLYQPVRLGNLVWNDVNNSGTLDGAEVGIDGVSVNLYRDLNGDGDVADAGETAPIASATTAGGGRYLFDNLSPGAYIVELPASNFSGAGVLAAAGTLPAYRSSTGVDGSASGPYEGAALADPDNNIDSDDSGTAGVGGELRSLAVTLRSQDEPAAATDTDDTNGNLTIDFGVFRPLSLGNLVWGDVNNNGVRDAGESGIDGVTVRLYRDSDASGTYSAGDALVKTTATAGGGLYGFSDLFGGDYIVVVPASNFAGPLSGFISSTGVNGAASGLYELAADPDSNTVDSTDNGSALAGDVVTLAITLSPAGEPTAGVDGDDANGNQTVDLGFFQPASLGDRVWHDQNANGVQDAGEPNIAGVSVTLYDSTNAVVASAVTDGAGIYGFANLRPDDYYVVFGATAGYSQVSPQNAVAATATTDSDANPATRRTATITLAAGQNDPTWDMGVFNPASLGNFVWEDTNGNGRQDAGEPGVAGAGLSLDYAGPDGLFGTADDQLALGSATTLADGAYSFGGLTPGSYRVTVTPPSGYQITLRDNAAAGASDTDDSDADRASGQMIATTLVSGQNDLTWDAGLYRPSALGDRVWEDLDGDGAQGAGEPGIDGVAVTLTYAGPDGALGTADDSTDTATTAGGGLYLFSGLIPGRYTVSFTRPAGYAFSPQDVGGDNTIDSDVPAGTAASGATVAIDLASNQTDRSWDAGLYKLLRLGNLVWGDANNNGQLDAGESGIDGVTVQLYRDSDASGGYSAGDSLVTSATTGGGGIYQFSDLFPGDYIVVIPASNFAGPLASLVSSTGANGAAAGPNEPAADPDSNTADSTDNGSALAGDVASGAITLSLYGEPASAVDGDDTSGNQTVDFGFFQPAAVGDFVWEDLNGDGAQDGGEPGVAGVTVRLYTGANTLVASIATDSSGAYSFGSLTPGSYYLTFSTLPAGYTLSPQDAAGGDDARDSDADPASGKSATFTLVAGQTDLSRDAGVYRLLSLGNQVWDDLNNNGQIDAGESGIDGVSVQLYRDSDSSGDYSVGDALVSTVATAGGGLYQFSGLAQGDYIVVVPASNFAGALEGYLSSTAARDLAAGPSEPAADPDGNLDGDDSGSLVGGQVQALAVRLSPAGEPASAIDGDGTSANQTVDFGFFQPASIGDRVWEDLDGDGTQDTGEQGVSGVTVTLYTVGPDGAVGGGDDVQVGPAATTDASGSYLFDNLPPGRYYLIVDRPASYFFTRRDAGADDTLDSDVDRTSGATIATDLTSGEADTTWDAGINQIGTLGDTVWEDMNHNGVQDSGEPGIPGVTVTLYEVGTNAQVGAPQTTDASGYYQFAGLSPNRYYVVFSGLPAGYLFTTPNQGGDDTADSDADPTSGRSGDIDLLSKQDDPTWDAGLYTLASLGDRVWNDVNANGVQDVGELGVNGVTVTLYTPGADGLAGTADDVTVASTATATVGADDGVYSFSGLTPDRYFLAFSNLPAGYIFSPANSGADDALDSDADRTSGRGPIFGLPSGANDQSWDAGIFLPARLGDFVWGDSNADGVQDAGEKGVSGVTVQLLQGGTVISSTISAADGSYHFDGLGAGDYTVAVVRPAGWQISPPLQGGDATVDSDIDRTSGQSQTITLTPGDANDTIDAGIYGLASVGNRVWEDTNHNGIFEKGEQGIAGVKVELYNSAGTLIATVFTDALGGFIITDLEPGSYSIRFYPPAGWTISPQDQGGNNGVDSDADPISGRTSTFTLGVGAADLTWWVGMSRPPTAISLLSFTLERQAKGSMLRWATGSELSTVGFQIYRSASGSRADAQRVTGQLLLAQGSGGGGASYSWLDSGADPQTPYTYWLVELERGGASHEYRLAQPALRATFRVSLPLIVR